MHQVALYFTTYAYDSCLMYQTKEIAEIEKILNERNNKFFLPVREGFKIFVN